MSEAITVGVRLGVTVDEAARMVGCSRATLYPLVVSGQIPSLKIGARRIVSVQALGEWMDRQIAGGPA